MFLKMVVLTLCMVFAAAAALLIPASCVSMFIRRESTGVRFKTEPIHKESLMVLHFLV